MRIPFVVIAPLIVIICVVGAYSVSNSYLDVVMMLGFYLFADGVILGLWDRVAGSTSWRTAIAAGCMSE